MRIHDIKDLTNSVEVVRTFIKLNYKTIIDEQLLLKRQDFSSCI